MKEWKKLPLEEGVSAETVLFCFSNQRTFHLSCAGNLDNLMKEVNEKNPDMKFELTHYQVWATPPESD